MANVYVLSAVPLRTVQLYAHPAHVRLFISTIATFWKEDGGYAVQENTLPRSFSYAERDINCGLDLRASFAGNFGCRFADTVFGDGHAVFGLIVRAAFPCETCFERQLRCLMCLFHGR